MWMIIMVRLSLLPSMIQVSLFKVDVRVQDGCTGGVIWRRDEMNVEE